jgi:hypothetical protein
MILLMPLPSSFISNTDTYIYSFAPEYTRHAKVQHLRLHQDGNMRIGASPEDCPGSTRYGHRHRRSKKKQQLPTPKIPLPVPISDSDIKYKLLNGATLCGFMLSHHLYHQKRIDCHFLLLFVILLCLPTVSSETNVSHLFSTPTEWSLDSSFDTCSLRCLSCVIRAVKRGVTPLYMADPSESTSAEVPDWLLEHRRKKTEAQRRKRANAPKKNDPVPGRLRTKKWREKLQKARTPVESSDTNAIVYVSNAIFNYTHSYLNCFCFGNTQQWFFSIKCTQCRCQYELQHRVHKSRKFKQDRRGDTFEQTLMPACRR